ncbi:hypothetical protein ACOI22_03330 [Glaciecola sp. 2405UD65-10]|uniref:hypothetical protein n=1 Tax=Glaciecola sp. 2405UD65-10 TaxID=3397244 RepID=UPI003B59BFD6
MIFPVDKFAKVEIEQRNDIRASKERLTRNRARGTKSPYFALMLTTPSIPYNEYIPLSAAVDGYEGALEIFVVQNPIPSIYENENDNTIDFEPKGSKTIGIDYTGNYSAGDFIQFSGSTKAYRIMEVDGQSITLTHPLLTDIAAGESVYYGKNVQFQMCVNDTHTTTIDVKQSKFGIIDVELIEQL